MQRRVKLFIGVVVALGGDSETIPLAVLCGESSARERVDPLHS